MNLRLFSGMALLAGLAVAAYYGLSDRQSEAVQPQTFADGGIPSMLVPTTVDGTTLPASGPSEAEQTTARLANPLQKATDLRAIYEQYRDSKDPRERNTAYRAWSACFPTFIAAQGGMVPVESVTASLPANDPSRALRAESYRELWGRCKRFTDLSHAQLVAETQRQKDVWMTGQANAPGDSAAQAHGAGNSAQALAIARAAVNSQDPYAIDSLREFVIHYWWGHNDNHPGEPIHRPDLRALAFSVAACQTGLECGAGSLTAVQQCANTGACTGTVVERYLQSLPNPSDRDALMAESRRVTDAIRAHDTKALGL